MSLGFSVRVLCAGAWVYGMYSILRQQREQSVHLAHWLPVSLGVWSVPQGPSPMALGSLVSTLNSRAGSSS